MDYDYYNVEHPDYYENPYSYESGRDEVKIQCREWIEGIIDQLYGFEDFNPDRLDFYLQELCHIVKVSIPKDASLRKVM